MGAGALAAVTGGVIAAVLLWPSSSGPLPEGIAARVGPTEITRAELDRAVAQARAADAFATGEDGEPAEVGTAAYREGVRSVMAALVQRAVIHREALRCGERCEATPERIAKERQKIVKDNFAGSQENFALFMEERALTEEDVTAILRQEIEQRGLVARYGGKPKVSRAQAQAYYRANRQQFAIPEAQHVSHILLGSRQAAARTRAFLRPDNFAVQARRISLDKPSARRGGLLAGVSPGASTGISEQFDRALAELEPGQISQPVRSSFGWHLIRISRTPGRTPPFAEIADEVRAQRRQAIIDQRLAKWQAAADKRWKPKTVYASADLAPLPPEPVAPQVPEPPAPSAPQPQVPSAPDPTPPVPQAPSPGP